MVSRIDRFRISHKTVHEMLTDRKYTIISGKECDVDNIDEVNIPKMIGKRNGNSVYVYFYFSIEKMGIKTANDIIDGINNADDGENAERINHCIIISNHGYTPSAQKRLCESIITLDHEPLQVETFVVDELMYNLTKHECQPQKIELITDINTINAVYSAFSINKNKNMKICRSDPVNRYFNGKPGEMYKVSHKGGRIDYVTIVK